MLSGGVRYTVARPAILSPICHQLCIRKEPTLSELPSQTRYADETLAAVAFIGETLAPFFLEDPHTGNAGLAFDALAALDVAGAPAQTAKLVKPGDSVLILGAAGKSGILCGYEAMKRVGPTGNVVAVVRRESQIQQLLDLGVCHKAVLASATEPADVLEKSLAANDGKEYDLSISCVNVENTEMSCILPVRNGGMVYFFSMATSFTKAALGAEGVGKDVNMIIGNGYTKDHADITLWELRESEKIRKLFEEKYI